MKLFEVFLTYLAVSSSKPVAAMRSLPPNIILFDLFPSSSAAGRPGPGRCETGSLLSTAAAAAASGFNQ